MTIANEYAVLSEDGKSLVLPVEVCSWLKDADRFLVIMEDDRLVLKKTRRLKKLDTLVTEDYPPLSSESLDQIIHESRS